MVPTFHVNEKKILIFVVIFPKKKTRYVKRMPTRRHTHKKNMPIDVCFCNDVHIPIDGKKKKKKKHQSNDKHFKKKGNNKVEKNSDIELKKKDVYTCIHIYSFFLFPPSGKHNRKIFSLSQKIPIARKTAK